MLLIVIGLVSTILKILIYLGFRLITSFLRVFIFCKIEKKYY